MFRRSVIAMRAIVKNPYDQYEYGDTKYLPASGQNEYKDDKITRHRNGVPVPERGVEALADLLLLSFARLGQREEWYR